VCAGGGGGWYALFAGAAVGDALRAALYAGGHGGRTLCAGGHAVSARGCAPHMLEAVDVRRCTVGAGGYALCWRPWTTWLFSLLDWRLAR